MCWCARSACTPPFLSGVCGVGVCARAQDSAPPRHFLLRCWGVLVGVHPRPVPRHYWLQCLGVCVIVCALLLYPVNPGWSVRCWCVCLGSGFGCAPSFLACVCLSARSACTAPFLAWVCDVDICARARFSAAPRHSWLGCLGVRVGCCPVPVPVPWFVAGCAVLGGCCCLAPVRVPSLWPAACLSGVPRGPALGHHASSGPVALGAPLGFPDAVVPIPSQAPLHIIFTWIGGHTRALLGNIYSDATSSYVNYPPGSHQPSSMYFIYHQCTHLPGKVSLKSVKHLPSVHSHRSIHLSMSRDAYTHTSKFSRFPFKWVNGLYSCTGYQPHYIPNKYLCKKCLQKHPLDPITAVTECTATERLRQAIINAWPPPFNRLFFECWTTATLVDRPNFCRTLIPKSLSNVLR